MSPREIASPSSIPSSPEAYIPANIHKGVRIPQFMTCDIIPEVNLGVILFSTALDAAIIILAFNASSTPLFNIRAAIGFTGASSIHRRESFVDGWVNATSRISSSVLFFGRPRILARAFTLGSYKSVSSNSVKTLRALCHSPLSTKHNAAAILGLTINGFSLTNLRAISKASL